MPKYRGKKKLGSNRFDYRADSQYWEARLAEAGLTMDAGRTDWISYGHMVADLDFDGRVAFVPTGESLDNDEWPISLC